RGAGVEGEITLTAMGLPPTVTAALKSIPKDQNEVKAQLNLDAKAPLGRLVFAFSGKAKLKGKDVAVLSAPVTLDLVAKPLAPTYPAPAQVRDDFLKLLDRPRVLFQVKMQDTQHDDDNGLVLERLSIVSEKRAEGDEERVPLLLVRPD